jgi:PiT family inorganic phosphate transporter
MGIQAILLGLTFLAVALVSGNNLSACVGPAIGSRIVKPRLGMLLGATGYSLGLIVQGSSMIVSAHVLLPNPTMQLQSEALLVAILVFVVAYLIRVPIALTMSLVGLLAGMAIAREMSISSPFVTDMVIMWFLVPVIAAASAFYLTRILSRTRPENIWRRIRTFKTILIMLSFVSAYVLGANTIGLLVATGGFSTVTLVMAIPAILLGSFYLSAGEIRRVSQELFLMRYQNATVALAISTILVELATMFSIPLSNTQALSSAVFGAGISYRTRFMSVKPFMIIIAGWIVVPLVSFAIGLVV